MLRKFFFSQKFSATAEEPKPKKIKIDPSNSLVDQFKQGDVVFGLYEPRDEILVKLHEKKFHHAYANKLNSPTISLIIENSEDLNRLDAEQKEYHKFLNKHRHYLMKQPSKPIEEIKDNPIKSGAFRRACKLMLISRDPERKYHAHVVTKGIDWDRVCDKKKSPLGLTNSEMRAAYRDYCKNGPNPFILFYDGKHKLMKEPPWKDPKIAPFFQKYDETRRKKNEKRCSSTSSSNTNYKKSGKV